MGCCPTFINSATLHARLGHQSTVSLPALCLMYDQLVPTIFEVWGPRGGEVAVVVPVVRNLRVSWTRRWSSAQQLGSMHVVADHYGATLLGT